MLNLKKCLMLQAYEADCLKSSRQVFAVDLQGSESYKKLQEASANATNLESWKEGGDKAQTEINSRCDSTVKEYSNNSIKDEKSRTEKAMNDYSAKEAAEAAKITEELTAKHKNNDKSKWKAEYDKLWMKRVKPIQAEKYAERDKIHKEVWDDIKAVQARLYSLRDTAITQMRAAFAAKEQAEKEVAKDVLTQLTSTLEQDDKRELLQKKSYALTFFQNQGSGVDYLATDEMKESDVERVAVGIAAALHNPDESENEQTLGKKFMEKLLERQKKDPRFDQGLDISDLRMVTLEMMGFEMKGAKRKIALKSEQAKLIKDIYSNDALNPRVRGMLIGYLAKSTPENREAMTKRVRSMFDTMKKGGLDKNLGNLGDVRIAPKEGDKIMTAYRQFEAFLDGQRTLEFRALQSKYNNLVAITGEKDEEVEKIIAASEIPELMDENTPKLTAALTKASESVRAAKVAEVKNDKAFGAVKKLYSAYRVVLPLEKQLDDLGKNKKLPLPEFVASLAEMRERAKSTTGNAELMAKADARKKEYNSAIDNINQYKADRAKYASNPKVKELPEIANSYSPITATTPEDILNNTEAYKKTLDADIVVYNANREVLAAALKPAPKSGGSRALSNAYANVPTARPKAEAKAEPTSAKHKIVSDFVEEAIKLSSKPEDADSAKAKLANLFDAKNQNWRKEERDKAIAAIPNTGKIVVNAEGYKVTLTKKNNKVEVNVEEST